MRSRSQNNKKLPLNYQQEDIDSKLNFKSYDRTPDIPISQPYNTSSNLNNDKSSSRKLSKSVWIAYLTTGDYTKFLDHINDFNQEEIIAGLEISVSKLRDLEFLDNNAKYLFSSTAKTEPILIEDQHNVKYLFYKKDIRKL